MPVTLSIAAPGKLPSSLADDIADDIDVYPILEERTRGASDVATIMVTVAWTAFVGGLLQKFGADAHDRIAKALNRLRRAVPDEHAELLLHDEATSMTFVFDAAALADERAIAALATARYLRVPGAVFSWRVETGAWELR